MSKTAQRKREYYKQGQRDYNKFGAAIRPFWRKDHYLNIEYMAGFHDAMEKSRGDSINTTLLQKFRELFEMETG